MMKDYPLEENLTEAKREERSGQKYLAYQLSWFGKTYSTDDDVTFSDNEQAKKDLIDFLAFYAENGEQIEGKENLEKFQKAFTELYDAAYTRADKNRDRSYGAKKMNDLLQENCIGYKVDGKAQAGPWTVISFNWEDDHPES